MRKLIDLDPETFKALKLLAVEDNTDQKNYIQHVLVKHVHKKRLVAKRREWKAKGIKPMNYKKTR